MFFFFIFKQKQFSLLREIAAEIYERFYFRHMQVKEETGTLL
jgi:hypothetical protein